MKKKELSSNSHWLLIQLGRFLICQSPFLFLNQEQSQERPLEHVELSPRSLDSIKCGSDCMKILAHYNFIVMRQIDDNSNFQASKVYR